MPEKSNQSDRVDLSLKYILGNSGTFLLNGKVTYFISKNNTAAFFPKAFALIEAFYFILSLLAKKVKKK